MLMVQPVRQMDAFLAKRVEEIKRKDGTVKGFVKIIQLIKKVFRRASIDVESRGWSLLEVDFFMGTTIYLLPFIFSNFWLSIYF